MEALKIAAATLAVIGVLFIMSIAGAIEGGL